MAYLRGMDAFWWFKENSIAGMARLGFNKVHWFDVPFDETLVFGWIGQRSDCVESMQSFQNHVENYGNKIRTFFNVNSDEFSNLRQRIESPTELEGIFHKVAKRTHCIDGFSVDSNRISFRMNRRRLDQEIHFLKANQFETIVSLTEQHHQKSELAQHFRLNHFAIDDLGAPQLEQAQALAALFRDAQENRKRIAVHCMAGIGRTSTMIAAAHIILGGPLKSVLKNLKIKNPSYLLTAEQKEFLEKVDTSTRNS